MKHLQTFFMLFLFLKTFAQQDIIIDLSNDKISDRKISTGSKKIIIINTLAKKTYKISTTINNLLPKPFTISSNGDVQGGDMNILASNCGELGKDIGKKIAVINQGVTTEKELAKKYEVIQKLMKDSLKDDCLLTAQKLLNSQKEKSSKLYILEGLENNQEIVVTIERKSEDSLVDGIWEFTLTTTSKLDKWLIHYGFTYQPNILTKYDQYFSKLTPGTTDSYTITKSNGKPNKAWENTSPSILFTHPFNKTYKDFMTGISFIAGTNFSTYSAGAGISEIIAYNGILGIGAMYTQKDALRGEYNEGDIIKQNLTIDQLHTKKGAFEFYITLALRFDKNPFSGGNTEKKNSTPTTAIP